MPEPIINIAMTAAKRGGELIVRVLDRLDSIKIAEKRPNDFVTEIDRQVEQEITDVIQRAYPNHGILGEEFGQKEGNDYQWIIDPIDGTRNFIHGFPYFAISIGVTYKNRIEHGVIYDPVRHELFRASRGKGAFLNDRRVRVSKQKVVQHALIGVESRLSPDLLRTLDASCGELRRAGASALDLAYVASGRLDAFLDLGLKPWDIAAGMLLVKEAGGMVVDHTGGENYFATGNVIAANPLLLRQLLKIVVG